MEIKLSDIWENYNEFLKRLSERPELSGLVSYYEDVLDNENKRMNVTTEDFVWTLIDNFKHIISLFDYTEGVANKIKTQIMMNRDKYHIDLLYKLDGQVYNGIVFDRFDILNGQPIDVKHVGEQYFKNITLEVISYQEETNEYYVLANKSDKLVFNDKGFYIKGLDRFNETYFDEVYNHVIIHPIRVNSIPDHIYRNVGFTFGIENYGERVFLLTAYFVGGQWRFGGVDQFTNHKPEKGYYITPKFYKWLLLQLYRFDEKILFDKIKSYENLVFEDYKVTIKSIRLSLGKYKIKLVLDNGKDSGFVTMYYGPQGNDYMVDSFEWEETEFGDAFLSTYTNRFRVFMDEKLRYIRII